MGQNKYSTCILFLALMLGLGITQAQDNSQEKILIILDASGSMWGQIEGRSKIEIAREVMTELVYDLPAQLDLGLMAYGHRSKGDCEDIELLTPFGDSTRNNLLQTMHRLSPKGKTPITGALKKAGDMLKTQEGKTTVVLISDGLETCGGDPCAMAKSLREAGLQVTMHVVGFDVSAEESAQLKCIAENGGGKYYNADSAGQLEKALGEIKEAVKTVAPAPKTGKANVTLQAVLSDDGPVITENGLSWNIYSPQRNAEGLLDQVAYSYDEIAQFDLEPGLYLVQARFGDARRDVELLVKPGEKITHTISLRAGRIDLTATLSLMTPVITENNISWNIYFPKPHPKAVRDQAAYSYDELARFTLTEGVYVVDVTFGDAKTSLPIRIIQGETGKQNLVLNAGRARVSLSFTKGGEAITTNGVSWNVYPKVADGKPYGSHAAYSYDELATINLNQGLYDFVGTFGAATVTKRINIVPGKDITVPINLNAGQITLTVSEKRGKPPITENGVSWGIFKAGDDTRQVTYSYDETFWAVLTAGSYEARATFGDKSTKKSFTIAAGEVTELNLTFK